MIAHRSDANAWLMAEVPASFCPVAEDGDPAERKLPVAVPITLYALLCRDEPNFLVSSQNLLRLNVLPARIVSPPKSRK